MRTMQIPQKDTNNLKTRELKKPQQQTLPLNS